MFAGAKVDLVDDDNRAVAAASENVRDTAPAISSRIEVVASDLFENLGGRRYDLILCNPPYALSSELDNAAREFHHEPRHGLDGGVDGLAVWRRVVDEVGSRLNPGGVLVGEAGGLSREFDAAFPQLRAVWVDLERAQPQPGGGFGVFVSLGDKVGVGLVG